MRCTQPMGFGTHNPLDIPIHNCSTCGQSLPRKLTVYAYDGMFDEFPLHEFEVNGETYREVVQEAPWSSGPMLFLCYERVKDGMRFNYWHQDEIDKEN